MEHVVSPDNGVIPYLAGLILIFAINLVWGTYKEKNKVTEEDIKSLKIKIAELDKQMFHFSNVISSYMENTITLTDKISEMNEKLDIIKGDLK